MNREGGTKAANGGWLRRLVRPIHIPIPLIELKTINAKKPPRPTAKTAAHKAHQSNHENRDCRRAITKATPKTKQSTGVTVSISIQNNGVADHPSLEALVAYHAQAPTNQTAEQSSSATESDAVETCLWLKAFI